MYIINFKNQKHMGNYFARNWLAAQLVALVLRLKGLKVEVLDMTPLKWRITSITKTKTKEAI